MIASAKVFYTHLALYTANTCSEFHGVSPWLITTFQHILHHLCGIYIYRFAVSNRYYQWQDACALGLVGV